MTEPSPTVAAGGVRVEGLRVRYGQTVAVDDVSLEVRPGEFFFLLGPSGCGKTSLLRAIGGLEPAAAGRVFIAGREVTAEPPYRRGAPMVFQGYALWPHMTILENAAYGLAARGIPADESRRRAAEALRLVGLADRAGSRPAELSGGQQQRVALARALAVSPAVVLLDEPLSNLDAKLRREMRAELVRLHREARFTAIYVTHDQEEALSMAERLALMRDGRIVELGDPRGLYERPGTRFGAEFLGEVNWLSAERLLDEPGGRVRLRTELGETVLDRPPESGAGGARIEVGFRPEAARSGPGPAGALRWSGRVEAAGFLGSEERIELRLASGGRLVLRLPAAGARPGQELAGHLEPGKAWLAAP